MVSHSLTGRATREDEDTAARWLSLAALVATFGAAIGLFTVSPLALETLGFNYISTGGSALSKVHPATLLAIAALGLRCLATPRPERTMWRLATRDPGAVLLAAAVIVMGLSGTLITHTPVTPLIDTFVLPILVLILLRDLDTVALHWLAVTIGALMCLNAMMALIEVVRGQHFIGIAVPDGASADPTRADVVFDWRVAAALDWRAEGLLGHPLDNGLTTAAFILCLVAPAAAWIPLRIRIPVLLLQSVAMFAFGARTALVLALVLGGGSALRQILAARRTGPVPPKALLIGLLATVLLVAGIAALLETDFAARTIERFFQDDGSSRTRLTMFSLFDDVSWYDLLFGPDRDQVATLQRIYGLEFGIESSWVGLALTYGFIVTAMTIVGLAAFSRSLLRVGGPGTGLVLIMFFILVSVAASLSGKITSLAMLVVLIVAFLRRDVCGRRPSPLRPV